MKSGAIPLVPRQGRKGLRAQAREKAAGARRQGARSAAYALVREHRSDAGDEADAVLSRDLGIRREHLGSADAVIIGAGAAGLFAAMTAARNARAGSIVLVDGARKIGAKILVSGGGRCNLTNIDVSERDFNGGASTVVRRILKAFTASRTIELFRDAGVPVHQENSGKLFPDSNRSSDVLAALIDATARAGVRLLRDTKVSRIERTGNGFELTTNVNRISARAILLATGGMSLPRTGSDGTGYRLARVLGHTIFPTTPALVPLMLSGSFHRPLSGISHEVELRVLADGRGYAIARGSLLWTHFGISGPAALDISRHWHRAKLEGRRTELLASLAPGMDRDEVERHFDQAREADASRLVRTVLAEIVPARVADALLGHLGIDGRVRLSQFKRDDRRRLAGSIVAWPLPVTRSRGYEHAEVTAGGIPLDEVDPATLESRICPGVFFAGEILDVDGRLGGFNFQWAWSSGYAAGLGLAARLRGC